MRFAAAVAFSMIALTGAAFADSPFCLISGVGGRDCSYVTLSSCRQIASSVDGACVANEDYGRSATVAPSPSGRSNDRAFADVAGAFRRGVEGAQQRSLAEAQVAQSAVPAQTISDDLWVAAEVCMALRSRMLQETEYERAQPYAEAFQICMSIVDPHMPK